MIEIGNLIFIIGVILVVVVIGYYEHRDHDCIPGKRCNHYVEESKENDSVEEVIDKIYLMVQNNYDYVTWRQSLLVGIIFSIPVVFYLKGRLPTLIEWFIVSLFIFIGSYLSFSWLWAHFCHPNSKTIEKNLLVLRDRLVPSSSSKGRHHKKRSSKKSYSSPDLSDSSTLKSPSLSKAKSTSTAQTERTFRY